MANYLTTDTDLTSVANAIRTKGGTSANLAFPSGFVSAINAIPSGSGPYEPTGYTRLKYLESSGTQIIDTGKYLKLDSKFVIDSQYSNAGSFSAYVFLFGSSNPNVYAVCLNYINTYPAGSSSYWGFGNQSDKNTTPGSADVLLRNIITFDKNGGSIRYYGEDEPRNTLTLSNVSVTENQSSHICLFGRGNNGSYERFSSARIYEYWYYEDNTLVQHMIPVKRNNDNVLGMYDIVSSTFFTNAGTGVFTGGAYE